MKHLCTYNEARIIKSTIIEIFKNLPNIKILLVDDDSPDGTYKIVEKLKLSNIRLEKRRDRVLKAFVRHLSYQIQNILDGETLICLNN